MAGCWSPLRAVWGKQLIADLRLCVRYLTRGRRAAFVNRVARMNVPEQTAGRRGGADEAAPEQRRNYEGVRGLVEKSAR